MKYAARWASAALLLCLVQVALPLPRTARGDAEAILRLRPDGPSAPIHVMRFSPDGGALLAAGDEKFVQVWTRVDGRFRRNHAESLRHPVGPGPLGVIHGLGISPRGRFVVVGGVGTFDQHAGFSDDGILIPSFGWSGETLDQIGTVTLFDKVENSTQAIKTHRGYVLAAELLAAEGPSTEPPSEGDEPPPLFLITIGNDEAPRGCEPDADADSSGKRSLRVFTLPDGRELRRWPLADSTIQPRLIAWSEGPGTAGLRIAVTLADGKPGGGIDLFTIGADTPTRCEEPFALAADRIVGTNQLCVASRRALRIINGVSGAPIKRIELGGQLSTSEFLFSVASIPRRPNLAAVTVRDLGGSPSQHRLNVVDLQTGRLSVPGGIPLGNRQNPVLAIDPSGDALAATADVTTGVKIFSIDALAAGKAESRQTLRPSFLNVTRAGLFTQNDVRRLRFSAATEGRSGTYELIDDDLRAVEAGPWQSFDTSMTFAKAQGQNEFGSTVTQGAETIGRIQVPSSIMPLGKWIRSDALGGRPIAAVAFIQYTGEAQPRLSLFDPQSGRELRRLNGHQQMVTGLEFSRDHRRLSSVSADGVVCVWKLDDLADLIGRRGTIEGVRWCATEQGMVISDVDGRAMPGGLSVGDLIVGLIDGQQQLKAFRSPERFFLALSRFRPGQDVLVRVLRGGRRRDVKVRLGQAADERKPLFSLVTADDPEGPLPAWLAWTPAGPFQSSGQTIESAAGWHFNPAGPGQPVQFAPFAQYREQFSGDSLVRELLANGQLPRVWPPSRKTEIATRLVDRKGNSVYADGRQYRISDDVAKLQVSVAGISSHMIKEVIAQVDSRRPVSFSRSMTDPEIWETNARDLPDLVDQHDLSVTVRSERLQDGFQREFWGIDVNPPPLPQESSLPSIELVSHSGRSLLRRSELPPGAVVTLRASLDIDQIPGRYRFSALRQGQEIPLQDVTIQANVVQASVPLLLGENRLAIQVSDGQDTRRTSDIDIEMIDPPSIESIDATVVNQNQGRLDLTVRSRRVPERADFRLWVDGEIRDTGTMDRPPRGVGDAATDRFALTLQGIPLSPGNHELKIATVDQQERTYDPRTASLSVHAPPEQPEISLAVDDDTTVESATFELAGTIDGAHLSDLLIRVDDQTVATTLPSTADDGTRPLAVTLPLHPGVNVVSVSAVTRSGLVTTAVRRIHRLQRPVGVLARRLVSESGRAVDLVRQDDGSYGGDRSSTEPRGFIEGHVRLPATDTGIDAEATSIRAWVNGFLQSVVRLKPGPRADELEFRVPVLLSSATNEIRLDLPGLVESEQSVADLSIDCDQPSRDQTLHLLVVSTRVPSRERKAYERRVHQLLEIVDHQMPAFSRVISGSPVYPTLTGDISRSDNVRQLVQQCRFELAGQQAVNNTVLVYFHGEEMRAADGRICLMTRDARPDRAFDDPNLITSTYLGQQFEGLKCANLLFLDVASHVSSKSTPFAGDPEAPTLGVLRLTQVGSTRKSTTPDLLGNVRKVLPRIGEIGQLPRELAEEVRPVDGLAVSESIPQPIRWMRFGELN